jgi:hypothetical protein
VVSVTDPYGRILGFLLTLHLQILGFLSTGHEPRWVGWMTEESGFDSLRGQALFSFPPCAHRLRGPHSLLSIGYQERFCPEVKRPEHGLASFTSAPHTFLWRGMQLITGTGTFVLSFSQSSSVTSWTAAEIERTKQNKKRRKPLPCRTVQYPGSHVNRKSAVMFYRFSFKTVHVKVTLKRQRAVSSNSTVQEVSNRSA